MRINGNPYYLFSAGLLNPFCNLKRLQVSILSKHFLCQYHLISTNDNIASIQYYIAIYNFFTCKKITYSIVCDILSVAIDFPKIIGAIRVTHELVFTNLYWHIITNPNIFSVADFLLYNNSILSQCVLYSFSTTPVTFCEARREENSICLIVLHTLFPTKCTYNISQLCRQGFQKPRALQKAKSFLLFYGTL